MNVANTHYGIGHGEILNILPATGLVVNRASELQITANGVTFTNNGSLYISGSENASTGVVSARFPSSGISVSGENATINNNGTMAITTFGGTVSQGAITVDPGMSLTFNNRGTLFLGRVVGKRFSH